MRAYRLHTLVTAIALIAQLTAVSPAAAQDDGPPGRRVAPTSGKPAWFSLPMPPAPGSLPAVVVGTRGPRGVTLPPGEPAAPELTGAAIRKDLDTLVGISKESRDNKEIGSGQKWGRISGFPSGAKTAAWAAEQFRKAGIADVRVQTDHAGRPARLLAAARRGRSSCSATRRSARAAPTSCCSRRCRSRRRTFPAAR